MREKIGERLRRDLLAPLVGVETVLLDPMIVDQRRARMPDRPADHACGTHAFTHLSASQRRSIISRGRAAIDGNRRTLNVAGALRAKEQRQRRDVFGLAYSADAILGGGLFAQVID